MVTYTGTKAWYTSSARYTAVAAWAAGHAYSVGDVVRPSATSLGITMTLANPAVFTWRDNGGSALVHNFVNAPNPEDTVVFNNNGDTLPSPLAFNTTYYVISGGLTTTAFELSTTPAGTAISTNGSSQAGTHSATGIHNGNERCYVCTVAGTSAASLEPVWTFTRGAAQPSDNGVIWVECTGIAMLNGDATNTPNWTTGAKSTTPGLGHVITDVAGTHVFICTTSGAAGTGSEPTWNVASLGQTTADASATWTYIGTVSTWQGKKWAAPHSRINNTLATNWGDTGTKFYVGDDHNEIQYCSGSTPTMTARGTDAAPIDIICVDHTGSVPPVTADLKTTGIISAIGGGYNIQGALRICYGIIFRLPSQGGNLTIQPNDSLNKYLKSCALENLSTGGSGNINLQTSEQCFVEYEDCTIKHGATGQTVNISGRMLWRRGSVSSGGSTPTTWLTANNRCAFKFEGMDLSNFGSTTLCQFNSTVFCDAWFDACKLPSTYTLAPAVLHRGNRARLTRCNTSTNTGQFKYELADYGGTLVTDTTAARTSGLTIDSTGLTWKLVSTANVNAGIPFVSPPFSAYNATVGSSVTATVHGIAFQAAAPNNDELWIDVTYPADTNDTISGIKTSRVTDFLTAAAAVSSAITADAWDGVASARQNSHAYSQGDFMKTATQPGMLYQCTTAGTSAGSEGSLYASATDGTSVTDGTAVFRGGYRFTLSCSFTPQLAGMVHAAIRVGKASATYYVEPLLNLA